MDTQDDGIKSKLFGMLPLAGIIFHYFIYSVVIFLLFFGNYFILMLFANAFAFIVFIPIILFCVIPFFISYYVKQNRNIELSDSKRYKRNVAFVKIDEVILCSFIPIQIASIAYCFINVR